MRYPLALSLLCTLALVGCNGYFGTPGDDEGDGDGGGDSDAQGIWVGTTSDRYQFHQLVTPNSEVWGLSWDEGANAVKRLTQGSGSLSGKAFNGTGKNFEAGKTGTVGDATLKGTVESASTFDGDIGQNVTFTSSFNGQYNNAFVLADFAGTWNGFDSTGTRVKFTVEADGKFTAESTIAGKIGTCTISGSLRAASSGKNYATSTLSFGSSTNCLEQQAGRSLQGVAVRLTENSASVQPLLLVEAVDTGKTVAWFSFARKQTD